MLGDFRKKQDKLIDEAEVVTLCRNYMGVDTLTLARDIAEEWEKQTEEDTDIQWSYSCMLAMLFEAGRLQGIREERAKTANKI